MIRIGKSAPSEASQYAQNIYSQHGEDGLLAEIFKRIGTTNKQCFEVGAADGKWFSNSRLLIDAGWKACLIEADEKNWPELDKLDGGNVTVVHGNSEPAGDNSLDSILTQCGFDAAMDLGVIDVDGQDYYLWNGMLRFKPRVMVVEFDPEVDPAYIPDLNGDGQAGYAGLCAIAASRGYFSAFSTQTNAIFIRNEEREKFYSHNGAAVPPDDWAEQNKKAHQQQDEKPSVPVLATGQEREIKMAAILSRPRFGLNVFYDCAAEALSPWHIPIQGFYGVFWGQCVQTAMEKNITQGIDWILTLDFDTLFSSQHLQMLIDCLGQHPEIDAIAALQPRRGRPLPLMIRADGKAPMTGGPVQATTAHLGLTLFRCESIKKLQKPWFWSTPAPGGSWGEGRLDDDIYFWGKWRDAGNTLYVHTGCRIGHVEEMAAEYDENYNVRHVYLTKWRQQNGQQVESYE